MSQWRALLTAKPYFNAHCPVLVASSERDIGQDSLAHTETKRRLFMPREVPLGRAGARAAAGCRARHQRAAFACGIAVGQDSLDAYRQVDAAQGVAFY